MALCSMAGGLLIAAPDPDLFDGRRSGSQSAHSGSGVSSSESGGEERNQSNTDENGEKRLEFVRLIVRKTAWIRGEGEELS